MKNIDGCFSIIVYNKEKDEIFVANDRLRGFPIFYYLDNNQHYVITDVLQKIITKASMISPYMNLLI